MNRVPSPQFIKRMLEDWTSFAQLLQEVVIKVGISFLCGLLLGIERERKDKPAGLRTIVLITIGSTLYMIISGLIPRVVDNAEDIIRADPARIAAQVVTGVGFLGAGTIIQARGSVHGLTTAAVIWVAAAIGLCVGLGFPVLALSTTLVILFVLVAMTPLGRWVGRKSKRREFDILVHKDSLSLTQVLTLLKTHNVPDEHIQIRDHGVDDDAENIELNIQFNLGATAFLQLLHALSKIDAVQGKVYNRQELEDILGKNKTVLSA